MFNCRYRFIGVVMLFGMFFLIILNYGIGFCWNHGFGFNSVRKSDISDSETSSEIKL